MNKATYQSQNNSNSFLKKNIILEQKISLILIVIRIPNKSQKWNSQIHKALYSRMHAFICSLLWRILECIQIDKSNGILTHNNKAQCALVYFNSYFTYIGFNTESKKTTESLTWNKVKHPNKPSCLSSGSEFNPFAKSTGSFSGKRIGPRIRRL